MLQPVNGRVCIRRCEEQLTIYWSRKNTRRETVAQTAYHVEEGEASVIVKPLAALKGPGLPATGLTW
jgi:hypothetical protein